MMKSGSVILDTDIGTDVDDCLALSLILASPELDLAAVTTVYGDVLLRARMVCKLLALRGVAGVPVAMGATRPLLGKRPVYWAGHEGLGLLGLDDQAIEPSNEHAVDLIVRTVMARPGQITLIAIGPLTNIALAFLREPRLADNLAGLVLMGGVVGGAPKRLDLPWTEHNFRCDPEATHIVLSAGAPTMIVPLDVTTQVCIRPDDVARIHAAGNPFHEAVAGQVSLYPPFVQRGWTHLHDPLAVATAIERSLVRLEPLRLVVETQGEHTAGAMLAALPKPDAPATAEVALEVDGRRAEEFIVDRLIH
jgi:purine nucleosidase